jgi:aminoglycoside phosphotransferase (APT) family kinase protein
MAPGLNEMLPAARAYVECGDWSKVPVMRGGPFEVSPLAQGEYNLNYLLSRGPLRLVLRVNVGTQIGRADQVVYEYRALTLLESSGVTPRPHFVDDTRQRIDRGVLIMDFLPGEPLDYRRDTLAAAALFARIHQVAVAEEQNHLIREDAPLTLIHRECTRLLQAYFDSPLAVPAARDYLRAVLAWADRARAAEEFYRRDPWPCIVNTEVNSGNFIVNRHAGTLHLVDWEMPRWGDPSQDLAHFCSPLTTLWKTDYRMSADDRRAFRLAYARQVRDRHLRDTLEERVRLREPFVLLRGIAWSAMAWAAYQGEFAGVKNPDTWCTLQRYMDPGFIRSLFAPYLARG